MAKRWNGGDGGDHPTVFEANELLCVGGKQDCLVLCLSHCVIDSSQWVH
jgi:hypothetical protein